MREGQSRMLFLILTVLYSWRISAQEISIRGGFFEDSILIGKDMNYWIATTYPLHLEMVFPDSLFDFSPFEYSSKTYFPSRLVEGNLVYDSTIYSIQSFEIDQVQYLQLPVIILNGRDSTIIDSPLDSVYLMELAPIVTDSTELKTNLKYQAVDTQFNYPLLYYILGGVCLLIIVLGIVFGKRTIKWFKLLKLRKRYEKFNELFTEHIQKLKVDPDPKLAEKTLILWKKYQERLDSLPFPILTTWEILKEDFTQELEKPLTSIDRMVYGNRIQEDVYQEFHQIEDFIQHRYAKKVEEIKNGK